MMKRENKTKILSQLPLTALASVDCAILCLAVLVDDEVEQVARVLHQILVLAIDDPVVELEAFVQVDLLMHRRDVDVALRVDRDVQEELTNLAQHQTDVAGHLTKQLLALVQLRGVHEVRVVRTGELNPLVDNLDANIDALESLVYLSDVLENLRK
jgi:hypothetical protein